MAPTHMWAKRLALKNAAAPQGEYNPLHSGSMPTKPFMGPMVASPEGHDLNASGLRWQARGGAQQHQQIDLLRKVKKGARKGTTSGIWIMSDRQARLSIHTRGIVI